MEDRIGVAFTININSGNGAVAFLESKVDCDHLFASVRFGEGIIAFDRISALSNLIFLTTSL